MNPVSSPPSEQARWFAEEVQPHEPMLRAWLHNRFPAVCDIDDIVQEAFLRVLGAHSLGGLQSPKSFLFAIARNLALDILRRRKRVQNVPLVESGRTDVLYDNDDVVETVARNQELEFLTKAIQSLPGRCRQVFTLRKVYAMSQAEIAQKLGISEHTVSAQLTIGVHKCTEFMARFRQGKGFRP